MSGFVKRCVCEGAEEKVYEYVWERLCGCVEERVCGCVEKVCGCVERVNVWVEMMCEWVKRVCECVEKVACDDNTQGMSFPYYDQVVYLMIISELRKISQTHF